MEIPASAGMTGRGARAADNPSSRRKSGSLRRVNLVIPAKVGISLPVCLVIPTKSRDLCASLSCHPDEKSGSLCQFVLSSRRKSGSLCQFVSSSRRKVGISLPVCLVIPTKVAISSLRVPDIVLVPLRAPRHGTPPRCLHLDKSFRRHALRGRYFELTCARLATPSTACRWFCQSLRSSPPRLVRDARFNVRGDHSREADQRMAPRLEARTHQHREPRVA